MDRTTNTSQQPEQDDQADTGGRTAQEYSNATDRERLHRTIAEH